MKELINFIESNFEKSQLSYVENEESLCIVDIDCMKNDQKELRVIISLSEIIFAVISKKPNILESFDPYDLALKDFELAKQVIKKVKIYGVL